MIESAKRDRSRLHGYFLLFAVTCPTSYLCYRKSKYPSFFWPLTFVPLMWLKPDARFFSKTEVWSPHPEKANLIHTVYPPFIGGILTTTIYYY